MAEFAEFRVGAAQASSVHFDKSASTRKACELIEQAGDMGVRVLGFGETWLPGYPFFSNDSDSPLGREARAEYLANAIEIPGPETEALRNAARSAGTDVVIGVVEKDPDTLGSVYATLLFISSEGEILGRHRKLKPTASERIVWGEGDGYGLRVYQRDYARISGLNCWEHIMMLPGYALAAQGTQVHVAAWPAVNTGSKGLLLSRALAAQAGCWVIAAGAIRTPGDVPDEYLPLHEKGKNHQGGSCIIDPQGDVVAEGEDGVESIVVHDVSMRDVHKAKNGKDIAGHYSRPDVFEFRVNRLTNRRSSFVDPSEPMSFELPEAEVAENGVGAELIGD